MLDINARVEKIDAKGMSSLPEECHNPTRPLILKGFVAHWPAVQAGLKSDEEAAEYIKNFYAGHNVVLYHAAAEKNGRFFYNQDYSALDFNSSRAPLDQIIDRVIACKQEQNPDTYYVGSTTVNVCLPGFRDENDIDIPGFDPLVSIWLGNHSCVAAHYDAPDNVACCVAGKRRFTLFPIEQAENLYMGPLDFTPSGQVISTVDFASPDFEKYPKFRTALDNALVAELEPGDALVLPSMWWHQVESLSDFNILVNYWWRDAPRYMEPPTNLLHLAILSLRDLPAKEKKAWKVLLDHYIFDEDEHKHEHLPESARGFLNPLDDMQARRLRAWLLNKLNR